MVVVAGFRVRLVVVLEPLLRTGVLRDVLGRLDRTGVLRDVLGRLDRTGVLRDVLGRLDRTGVLRDVLGRLDRTGVLREVLGRLDRIGVLRDVLGRLDRTGVLRVVVGRLDRTGTLRVVTERLGVARRVVVVLRVGVALRVGTVLRVGVARLVVDVTRVGVSRLVVVAWLVAPRAVVVRLVTRRAGCCAFVFTERRVASVVRRTLAVDVRAAGDVLGLSTVRRTPVAVTRLGDCCAFRPEATRRLALTDVAFAADARLTDVPRPLAYARLPLLALLSGRNRVRVVLRSLLSPYTTTVGLRYRYLG